MRAKQLDSGKSPRFAQPATFMRLPHQTDLAGVDVAMLGVPFDIIVASKYVQVGIRGPMYGEDEDFAYQRDQGVTTIDIGMVKRDGAAKTMARVREIVGAQPLYVTFDIDSVDPAFAPGTGTPEVGGLTSYEAQRLVRELAGLNLVACDIVEVAPSFDGPGQITALLAGNIMFELLCVIALIPDP